MLFGISWILLCAVCTNSLRSLLLNNLLDLSYIYSNIGERLRDFRVQLSNSGPEPPSDAAMCHHYTATAPSRAWTCVQCSSQAKQTPYQWLSVFIPGSAVLTLCEVIAYRGIIFHLCIYIYRISCVCLFQYDAATGSSRLVITRDSHFYAGPLFACYWTLHIYLQRLFIIQN